MRVTIKKRVFKIANRFTYLFFVCIFFNCQSSKENVKQPNIILTMADDLGFECLESYGRTSYNTNTDNLQKKAIPEDTLSKKEKMLRNKFEVILDSLNKYPPYGYVQRLDSAIDKIIPKNAKIELIGRGFKWSEGPVWLTKKRKLLFSDVPENKIYEWTETEGIKLFMSPSGYTGTKPRGGGKGSNGLTLDLDGNLVLCQQGDRIISKLISLPDASSPKFEPIVTHFKGKKFNSPNDAVFDSKGNMYFTDPDFGLLKNAGELGFNGVYFYSKKGNLVLLDKTIDKPNGIAVSNDNKTLYVSDSNFNTPSIWAYDIISDGIVKNKRRFFDASDALKKSLDKQKADGIRLDSNGNIFFAGPGGILVINPEGKHLGTITLDKKTGNCEFADNGKYLFITCHDYLLRVTLK